VKTYTLYHFRTDVLFSSEKHIFAFVLIRQICQEQISSGTLAHPEDESQELFLRLDAKVRQLFELV